MGTHRSKHNKGRKPLYKEHRTNLVETSPFFERSEFDVSLEAPVVRPAKINLRAPDPVLVDAVAKFLAARRAPHPDLVALHGKFDGKCHWCGCDTIFGGKMPNSAIRDHVVPRNAGGPDISDNIVLSCFACNQAKGATVLPKNGGIIRKERNGYFSATIYSSSSEGEAEGPACNDMIARMFFERKLKGYHCALARRWQNCINDATLQPSGTPEWVESVTVAFPYQRAGELSDNQADAMTIRNQLSKIGGKGLRQALDFCLDGERSLTEIAKGWRTHRAGAESRIKELLAELGRCTEIIEGGRGKYYDTFWRSDENGNGKTKAKAC